MPTDPIDLVHPELLDLVFRFELLPPEQNQTESALATSIFLALQQADPVMQAFLVSRIIPEEELAAERLRAPEVQDIRHRVVLDHEERKAAFRFPPNERLPPTNGEECLICSQDARVRAPCGCNYCLSCFREAIKIGLRSQEEFPPKCCVPFDEAAVRLARSAPLVHLFRQMDEEHKAPVHDRLYCHDGNCAAFIPPDQNGRCLLCHTETCPDCGGEGHPDRPCAASDAEEDVWATMDQNRSVNCPGCGRMIALAEACNHMTCPCGSQFCFLCGERWHTCLCPLYGHYDQMVPMRHRPGIKPPQFRRRPQVPTAIHDRHQIPQLRPVPGGEDRVPQRPAAQRVIRDLHLPQQTNAELERRRDERRRRENLMMQNDREHHGLQRDAPRRPVPFDPPMPVDGLGFLPGDGWMDAMDDIGPLEALDLGFLPVDFWEPHFNRQWNERPGQNQRPQAPRQEPAAPHRNAPALQRDVGEAVRRVERRVQEAERALRQAGPVQRAQRGQRMAQGFMMPPMPRMPEM
ncbi:putative e3 ubiquitin-protein ligase ari4, partial [Fusarium flagelliforme]